MKVILALCFAISALAAVKPQGAGDVYQFAVGFVVGLGMDRLTPAIHDCQEKITASSHAFQQAMQLYAEHKPFYDFMNNFTYAIGTVTPVCRVCSIVPEAFKKAIEEQYMKKFDSIWAYLHAVFINLGFSMDEIIYLVLKTATYMGEGKYYLSGESAGKVVNIVLNVTSDHPTPPDPPTKEDDELSNLKIALGEGIHDTFRAYFNYTMITLNYTKWVNTTTINNLNSSVMDMEMKWHLAVTELSKPQPNVLEGFLLFTDSLQFVNKLFNGIWFTMQQAPERMFKDSIFQYITYAHQNLIQHLGYFLYHGKLLLDDMQNKQYLDMCRRLAIIFRKILYFDEDVLDDISTVLEIQQDE